MRKILLKTTSDPFLFQWMDMPIKGVNISTPREFGTLSELSEELKSQEPAHIIFLAPAVTVQVRQLSFLAAERKHLPKTVPYTLEEEMICDVSELHCVLGRPDKDRLWVAAVQKHDLEKWLQQLEAVNLKINECIPEQVVLLDQENEWCMYFENGEFLLRSGGAQIHGIDLENIALALELATQNYTNIPESIQLFLNEEADREDALAKIPEQLHPFINTQLNPLPNLLSERMGVARELDFLTGEYSNSLNWAALIKKWQSLLWLLLAGFLVHAGVSFAEYKQQDNSLRQMRVETIKLHKMVFPNGKLVNSRRVLEGELKRLKGDFQGDTDFLPLLKDVSDVLEQEQDYQVNTLTFNAGKGALELDFILNSYSDVEAFKTKLADKNLKAELLNSVEQNKKVKARMLISGDS